MLFRRQQITLPVSVAWSAWSRLRGLLGRPAPAAGTGLLLPGCSSVHTIGMRYAIDVVFLDADARILSVRPRVQPGRWFVAHRGAAFALEMAAGEAAESLLRAGDVLHFLLLASVRDGEETRKKKRAVGGGSVAARLLRFVVL
jgi:uncharacterized membrane protein (UPF0127 family)